MSKQVLVDLPDEEYETAKRAAQANGLSLEDWATQRLLEGLPKRDARLRSYFGAVNKPEAIGAQNEQIDADIADEYASTHEEE
jgi:hypothetical protein